MVTFSLTVPPVDTAHPIPCVTHGDKCPAEVVTCDWALEVPYGGKNFAIIPQTALQNVTFWGGGKCPWPTVMCDMCPACDPL